MVFESLYAKIVVFESFTLCHERQLQGQERKAKVEGSQLQLYKAKEGRNMKLSACLNILGSLTLA